MCLPVRPSVAMNGHSDNDDGNNGRYPYELWQQPHHHVDDELKGERNRGHGERDSQKALGHRADHRFAGRVRVSPVTRVHLPPGT